MHSFSKSRNLWDELGSTLQKFAMEKSQRSASAIEKYRELAKQQIAQRARVRVSLALESTSGDKKRMEFINRNINAALNIRRCAVLQTRPAEQRRSNFVGGPTSLEMWLDKN